MYAKISRTRLQMGWVACFGRLSEKTNSFLLREEEWFIGRTVISGKNNGGSKEKKGIGKSGSAGSPQSKVSPKGKSAGGEKKRGFKLPQKRKSG